jgi:hypothetical protein
MADQNERGRDVNPNPAIPDADTGTTRDADFGRSDRYANKDEGKEFNVRNIGDGSEWDSGRGASIGHGTHSISDTRSADAETPGVETTRDDTGE